MIETSGSLLVVKGVFDIEITHPHMNVIRRDTISYEYFWLDRWYNVFRFHEPEGPFRNYYCNVSMPPNIKNSVIDYVDLDIDIVVDPAGRITVLDVDEFYENAQRFNYPEEIHVKTSEAVDELGKLIEKREFPFHDRRLLQQTAGEHVKSTSDSDLR